MSYCHTFESQRRHIVFRTIAFAIALFSIIVFTDSTAQTPSIRTSDVAYKQHSPALDCGNMPLAVQQKINDNKAAGNDLLNDILTRYTVDIDGCETELATNQTLSFLLTKNLFVRHEIISAGRVALIVKPAFDSVALKERLHAAGLTFNFINEEYFVNE